MITDLFLGAVWADDEFTEGEQRAVRALLAELLVVKPDELPEAVEERISSFDPLRFDLDASAQSFASDPPMAKRRLLELVGKVVDADGVTDMQEDEYLRRLADALGMSPAEYTDLVLDYDVEELRGAFEALRAPPPPMVGGATTRTSRPPPPPIVKSEPAPDGSAPPPPMVPRKNGG